MIGTKPAASSRTNYAPTSGKRTRWFWPSRAAECRSDFEIASKLALPLDVFVVRKLGVPGQKELAMGAIASGGIRVLNEDVLSAMPHAAAMVAAVTSEEDPRSRTPRTRLSAGTARGRDWMDEIIILVDDGLATGATMLAAIAALRQKNPAKIVVAVPVCPPKAKQEIERAADEVVILVMRPTGSAASGSSTKISSN